METEAYRTPIQKFYAGQSIFITGIYFPPIFYFQYIQIIYFSS